MRYLITNLILVFLMSPVFAQVSDPAIPEVKSALVDFNGGKYNGYIIEYNASSDIVEEAVKEKFKLEGMKPKETKDFLIYRGIRIASIDPVNPVDAFIKVDRKSRKEKDQSIVYFIATKPGAIPEEKVKSDSPLQLADISVNTGGAFLTSLTPDVQKGVFNKAVINQQSQLKKEEKKLGDLKDDQSNLEKKLRKLQSDMEYNKKAQERQVAEIEKAKLSLTELEAKDPSKPSGK